MRVLFTACPAQGHIFPLVPLAWAVRAAGHEVLVAVPEQAGAIVTGAGLPMVASSGPLDVRQIMRPEPAPDRISAAAAVGRGFGRMATYTIDGVDALVRDWKPDLVVTEPEEYAGPIAAAAAGIPFVVQTLATAVRPEQHAGAAEELAELCARRGLPGLPEPELVLDICPPQVQVPGLPTGERMRHVPYGGADIAPDWLHDARDRPLVCVTAGTIITRQESVHRLLKEILDELGRRQLFAVLAVGREVVPQLGRLLDHVVGVGWVPLGEVLPSCSAIVHHGGAGSMMASLVHGVPQVVLPFMADNFDHADGVAASGAGVARPAAEVDGAWVGAAVARVLDDPQYRAASDTIAADIAAQPSPAETAERLVRLVEGAYA